MPDSREPVLDAALARGGLDAGTRLLALATAAIWPADWPRLRAVVARTRTEGIPRAQLEEALLQATLFFGFPRAVSAFEHANAAWPPAAPPDDPPGSVPPGERAGRGGELFDSIYGRNAAAVRSTLRSFHREFHDFVIEAAYGRVLARPGLPPKVRELLAVTALAALDQVPQFVAHARGALAFGAEREAVREATFCALGDDDAAAAMLRRV